MSPRTGKKTTYVSHSAATIYDRLAFNTFLLPKLASTLVQKISIISGDGFSKGKRQIAFVADALPENITSSVENISPAPNPTALILYYEVTDGELSDYVKNYTITVSPQGPTAVVNSTVQYLNQAATSVQFEDFLDEAIKNLDRAL